MPPTAGTEESKRLNVYEPFSHKSNNKPESSSFIQNALKKDNGLEE